MIDYKKFVENSRNWLTDYILDNRLQSIVCGVSGGIDSTVSLAIASPVCKGLGVQLIGRSLPAHTNNPEEINSANLVGNAFCSDYKEVSIERIYAAVADELELNEGKLTPLQLGNIKARYRMIYLYNLASIHSGCVIDNDNFTEYNLGFYTIHGDQGDLNLGLHYLWKTEIYELAKYLLTSFEVLSNRTQEINDCIQALRFSIGLTPTDGNGVSKSDCDQFGLDNYEQVDDVLKTMYYSELVPTTKFKEKIEQYKKQGIVLVDPEGAHHFNEYIRLIDSYNEQGVDKVMILHQNTEFKRKPAPIMPTAKELEIEEFV